jgi:hypothetical protein
MTQVFYDTVYFDEVALPNVACPLVRPDEQRRMFATSPDGGPRTNFYGNGCLPAGQSFRLTEFGVRADLDGPVADDMKHAVLRALSLKLVAGNKEVLEVPPGGFYPPGMTMSVEAWSTSIGKRIEDAAGPIKPLESHEEEAEPPWLRGGFCRFVPVRLQITLSPFVHFYVELAFVGAAQRMLIAAQREGLLRGELAVLLGGVLTRDCL